MTTNRCPTCRQEALVEGFRRVNQVFINLLKNAVAAIEGTDALHLATSADEQSITVRISDTGRGIPPDRLKRIFGSTFDTLGGRVKMGSVLSTVYNIIREHEGEITADSEPGRGSTVTVRLPIQ